MIIGIDASNVVSGGGLVHIQQVLRHKGYENKIIRKIIIWSSDKVLNEIEDSQYIVKKKHFLLNRISLIRILWNIFLLNKELKKEKCDLLLVLGGYNVRKFQPTVIICQNMLPFESNEISNYGLSIRRIKLNILSFLNKKSLISTEGIIFLSRYAKEKVNSSINIANIKQRVIPHGISKNFYLKENKIIREIKKNDKNPFNIIYVSTIDMYKHQWNVVEAVSKLNRDGYQVNLELVGDFYKPALKKLNKSIKLNKNIRRSIVYHGKVSHDQLAKYYINKDLIIFASSCENLPITLIEGMATQVPIISSSLGPMKEVLGDTAYYFNPYNVNSIYDTTKKMILSKKDRIKFIEILRNKSLTYDWKKTSKDTFNFLMEVISYYKS